MAQVLPSNSIEFEMLTAEPAWGEPSEFDTNPLIDKEGAERKTREFWRLLGFLNRDTRLGNLSNMFDDFVYLEDRAGLTTVMLHMRDGAFADLAPLAINPVACTVELSQSRGGFFRKNAKTAHIMSENTEKKEEKGFLSRLFGGGSKENSGGG